MAEKRIRTSAGRETASQTVARIKSSLGTTSSRGSSRPNESVDQTVSRANAMLAQTKAEGSKSFAGSTFEKTYTDSIGTKQVAQNPLISLPIETPPNPVGDVIGANNAVLAPGFGATTDSKGFVSTPVKDSTDQSGFQSNYDEYMSSLEAPPSTESIYRKAPELRERNQAQQEVNTAQAELNNIIAKRDADVLSVVGQGRGIPEAIIGGQQAQLEREAAIRALPIQAKLAAAQGNLEMAQSNLNTMMQLRIQDAQMQYQFNSKMLDAVYNFANGQEQRRLDAMKVAEQRKFEVEQNFIKTQTGVMSDALANGAPTSVITAIQNTKTPQEALAAAGTYIGRIQRLQAMASIENSRVSRLVDLAKMGQPAALKALGIPAPDGSEASDDLIAYAELYASSGKKPTGMPKELSFGDVAEYAKSIPKKTGTLVSTNTGVTDTSLGTAEQGDITRLYNIVKMTEELEALDKERFSGVVAGTLGKITGSEAQGSYLTRRKAIVDELARMQTGAALTNDEQSFYNDYLPGRFAEPFGFGQDPEDKIANFKEIMVTKLDNALANNQLGIYGYSKVGDYKLGEIITNEQGQKGVVGPDGRVTLMK